MKLNSQCKWFYTSVSDLLEEGRKVKGWVQFKSTRDVNAFYNTKLGVVLKLPACILEPRTPIQFRVPTYVLENGWMVQPLVQKINRKKAVDAIRKKMKPYLKMGMWPDLHTGNVGWYKGKPLMFDW
jgi:hypothetical protein